LTSDLRTPVTGTTSDAAAASQAENLSVTILGCRSGMPAGGQASSGYLVETPGARLLLDAGPGISLALSERGGPETLDAVVISHFHVDHCYDLLPLGKSLVRRLLRISGPMPDDAQPVDEADFRSVPLYVPRGGRALLTRWAGLFPIPTLPVFDKAFEVGFDVREYGPGDILEIGDCEVTMHGLPHAAPNCGARVSSPHGVIAYTGDTGMSERLVDLARDADVFLAEATLLHHDDGDHGHLCGREDGEIAAAAGVGRLVLTHFISGSPRWLGSLRDDAASEFSGPIDIARPGDRYAVDGPTEAPAVEAVAEAAAT